MTGLVRAEFRKLLSTQVWFWLLLASVAVSALLVIVQIATRNDLDASNVTDVFTAARTGFIGVFVLGVLGVTTEFRYQTITPTFLTTPSRWLLIAAKLICYALTGVVFALACVLVTVVIAVPWLSAKDIDYSFTGDHVVHALIAIFVIVLLYGLLGLGVGAFVKNQIAAVTIGVVYLLIVENLLSVIPYVRNAYPYLPGGGADAIIRSRDAYFNDSYHVFSTAGGVAVLLIWAAVLAVAGAAFSMNRDIT